MISQAYGAKDEKRLRHYVAMSTYLCVILAIIMTTGLLLANGWILTTMNTPEKIYADTWKYIAIIYAGLPATILYNMLAAIARSLGDSKTPLVFLVLSSILNIGLDFLLVAVIPLGVSALLMRQSQLRQYLVFCVWFMYGKNMRLYISEKRRERFHCGVF